MSTPLIFPRGCWEVAADPGLTMAVVARAEPRRYDEEPRTTWGATGLWGTWLLNRCPYTDVDPWVLSWQPPGATKPADIMFARSMHTAQAEVVSGHAVAVGALQLCTGLASLLRTADPYRSADDMADDLHLAEADLAADAGAWA